MDAIEAGRKPGTLRGYVASIKWLNSCAGVFDDRGFEWNSRHGVITRILQFGKLDSLQTVLKDTTPLGLNQSQLRWLWCKFINDKKFQNIGMLLGYFIGILTAARPSNIFKTKKKISGLNLSDITINYSYNNDIFQILI